MRVTYYAAAKCWAADPPYEAAVFTPLSELSSGALPTGPSPTHLDAGGAAHGLLRLAHGGKAVSLMNFGASMVLFWACYRLVHNLWAHRWDRYIDIG